MSQRKKKRKSSKPEKEQKQKAKVKRQIIEMQPAEAETLSEQTTDMSEETPTLEIKQAEESVTPQITMKKSRDLTWLWAGGAGGCVVILLICLIGFIKPEFRHSNYYICDDPSMLKELLTAELSPTDSVTITKAIVDETARRKDAIEDLLDQKMIVSSEEFASNISGYYNTLIAVLSAILIILNLFGFFSWRSNANSSLEQKQRELDDAIKNIDDLLEKNLEETFRKNLVVKEKLESMINELIDQGEKLDDEEWEKLHLLLKQYKRKETLESIKADETENDGEIEE